MSAAEEALPRQTDWRARLPLIVWAITAAIALAIVALIIGAPLLQSGHPQFSASVYRSFSFVCHQIPERSFHLAGNNFAVCSRCTGLYAGFAITTLCYPLARSLRNTDTPSRLWLILATLPLGIDFGLTYFGVWQNTHLSRFVTGALLSSVAVFYIVPGLIDLGLGVTRRFGRV